LYFEHVVNPNLSYYFIQAQSVFLQNRER